MQKTLGGDRLGAGKKMKVHLHGYERSTHNLGYLWRSTMAPGTLVPFISEVALPGDTWDIDLNGHDNTHPTIGPLFGSFKHQYDVFLCPIRLYQGQLHNNKLGIGMNMAAVKLPLLRLPALPISGTTTNDQDNAQVNPSHLISYLGIRGIGIIDPAEATPIVRDFNAIPYLSYWDIYKNYYSNKQEEIGAVIHTNTIAIVTTVTAIKIYLPSGDVTLDQSPALNNYTINTIGVQIEINYVGATPQLDQIMFFTSGGYFTAQQILTNVVNTGTSPITGDFNIFQFGITTFFNWDYISPTQLPVLPPTVDTFQLSVLDDMRELIMAHTTSNLPFVVNEQGLGLPYDDCLNIQNDRSPLVFTQEGLGIKTYQSDLFNNWLSTDWIDGAGGISEVTAIDTSGGSFTIDTLNLSKKVYNMLNRIAVSGGTYDDWQDAVWAHERFMKAESPIYCGGLSKELVFQEVISNSQSDNSETPNQPLGTLAGKGQLSNKHKGGHITIKVDEPCYIIGITSLTPRLDYSQGNKWDTHLMTMDDFHKPALDEIGFQELIQEQMAWWTTYKPLAGAWTTQSAGKQPAWINYMTNVNQVRGNFAIQQNEMFMVLNRRYTPPGIGSNQIADLTTYIDPAKFNHIFAQTSLDAQNFWVQISVDITCRRKMSAKLMPTV